MTHPARPCDPSPLPAAARSASRDRARAFLADAGGQFLRHAITALGMNSLWVRVLTGWLDGSTWWPIVAVTPVAMFWLNRLWVFE